jgi:putative N6-adenine-specific DNA methylase
MVLKTRRNLRGFSFGRFVNVQSLDFNAIEANPEIEFLMCNPPYDERLSLEDEALYQQLGTWLKHKMQGVPAWIISSNEEGWKAIGLKPSKKYEVFNGDLRCSFRRYDTFAGSKATVTENDIKKA